ncbi:MAG: glycosyltransferase family 4 protein [Bryobacterales bacterium]|nr:glycosyltransferase family 4 protein [Bryobacterales bacterium]
MKIAYITAGAAGTICGNCLQDNAVAAALKRNGHDVILLPAYTPLRTDEHDESDRQVVFGGINLYLQGHYALFRASGILDRLVDHPRVLRWVSRFAVDTRPAKLGKMTRDMFLGESGPYRREMRKLIEMLRKIRPEVVHLTNSMLASMSGPIRRELGVPVICSIQGEADFLAGLPEPFRESCYDLLRGHAAHIDTFVAPCADQLAAMAPVLGEESNRMETILPGISLDGVLEQRRPTEDRFVIGFLARLTAEKGLHLLADAVERLRNGHPDRTIELRVAGWRNSETAGYVQHLAREYGFEDHGYLSRSGKFEFLAGLDAFSVPTTYRASKGLYVLEALGAGVPVIQPRIGVFPELIQASGGGLTCEPDDSEDLAAKLEVLMLDRNRAARLGARGQQRVRERFHSDRMAAEALALYARFLS